MTWTDELIEEAVKAVGEEGTPQDAIDWLTKVIPCPTPVCREEPMDDKKFQEVQKRLRELLNEEAQATEDVDPKDVDDLAELAALTVERWSLQRAVKWAVAYNSAEPNEGRETKVQKRKK
eukprot:TRINITY_DN1086_c0_g7_i1.p1 TRINITY_DN1086_c0_g7~~TRINITY_DN1086_c0_g7_i1.p1  ORF type:complete len:120 (-),score=31.93 TRINITY_DN1086_c0_g7_i1:52-411(-)